MNGEPPDVVQVEAMAPEEVVQRGDREVAQVLVVDGVELAVVDEILDVRHLDDCNAVVLEQARDAAHEAVGVGHVGEDVVGVDDVGPLALGGQ